MEKKIKIGKSCNNNCKFCCFIDEKLDKDLSAEEVRKTLLKAKEEGIKNIILSGGEPALRSDFFDILKIINDLGIALTLKTNARIFSSEKFCDKISNYEIDKFSVYPVNDEISQVKGGFLQSLKGIKNLINAGKDIEVNIVIDIANYRKLSEYVKILSKLGIKKLRLIYPEPKKGMEYDFERIIPCILSPIEAIAKARDLMKKENIELLKNKEPFNYRKPKNLLKKTYSLKHSIEKDKAPKKVSVIIPTSNRKKYLKNTLKALFEQNYPKNQYEIIIVDDNSKDGSLEMVKSLDTPCDLKYIFWPRDKDFVPGKPMNRAGPARNVGVSHSKGEIIIFIDCDIKANPNFINEHVESQNKWDIVIGPSLREKTGEDVREDYFNLCNYDINSFPIPWTLAHEGNISFKRKDFLEAGGFDEDFVYWAVEGDELAYRFYEEGKQFYLNKNAYGIHQHHPPESVSKELLIEGMVYNGTVFYKKHLDKDIFDRYFVQDPSKKQDTLKECLKQLHKDIPYVQRFTDCIELKKCKHVNLCRCRPNLVKQLIFNKDCINNNIFFRADDVAELGDNFKQMINIFIEGQIPINLQVIPGKVTEEAASWILQKAKENPGIIEINQHGWKHINYSDVKEEGAEGKYEFGKKRSYEQQLEDIKKGKEKLQEIFGDLFYPAFTPPFHGFDNNTLKVLGELNFSKFSRWTDSNKIGGNEFSECSANVDLMKHYRCLDGFKDYDEIIKDIIKTKGKNCDVGILIHHSYMNSKLIEILKRLLKLLKLNDSFNFKKISELKNPVIKTIKNEI